VIKEGPESEEDGVEHDHRSEVVQVCILWNRGMDGLDDSEEEGGV